MNTKIRYCMKKKEKKRIGTNISLKFKVDRKQCQNNVWQFRAIIIIFPYMYLKTLLILALVRKKFSPRYRA